MLSQQDVDIFEELKQKALCLLPECSLLAVVDQHLYLAKDGSWHVKFMMSGYLLGKPSLKELLKAYVFAVSGVDPTDEQIEDRGPIILGRLAEDLGRAINELQTTTKAR